MSRDSVGHTLIVATVLCVVCSLLVSAAAVGLRPRQELNKERDRQKTILELAGLYDENTPSEQSFESIESRLVDLETGQTVPADQLDPATYDQRRAVRDPEMSVAIPSDADVAGIGRREKYSVVYFVRKDDQIDQIILPIYGKGLWSTMYGFLSLGGDANTVRGITFYEHGETPGLGGEIDNVAWQQLWKGKQLFDDGGQLRLRVIKGTVDTDRPEAPYEVDGISGATITANGVTNTVQYWLGPEGYGPFLDQLKSEGVVQ